jgi:hypothetical protein
MNKNLIAAAVGGVLATGFMVLGAPVASAAPCSAWPHAGQPCSDCLQAAARAGHTGDVGAVCGMPQQALAPGDAPLGRRASADRSRLS